MNGLSEDVAGPVLSYDIPTGAKKLGPITTRDPSVVCYNYNASGADISPDNMVGREFYYRGQMISRELFRNGVKHGVQQNWHRNGIKGFESPYRAGKMHGTFRVWNNAAQLIGQYEMRDGTGTKIIYTNDGILSHEEEFVNGRENGIFMNVDDVGITTLTLLWNRSGKVVGKAFSFYPPDQPDSITCYSEEGDLHGPAIVFSQSGAVIKKAWYVKKAKVSESEYAAAASRDPTLPPYYADAIRYKEFANSEIKAVLKKYRDLPRVKIPLELDKTGKPVLAKPPR